MNENVKAHLALFTVALIYGSNYIIAKDVMVQGYLDPFTFIMLRVSVATTLFFLFHKMFLAEKVARQDMLYLAVCGLFGVATNQLCFFIGLEKTSPIHASLIMTATPILVLILSKFIHREHINTKRILGIILGLVGAVVLVINGAQSSQKVASPIGDLYVLANATSYAIYLVIVKNMIKKYNPITVIKWVFFFGMLYVIPFGLKGLLNTDFTVMPSNILLAIAFVLLFTTFLAYLLNAYALKKVRPSTVGFYIYFQPLIATVLAIIVHNERLDSITLIAAGCLFLGVYLTSNTGKKASIKRN